MKYIILALFVISQVASVKEDCMNNFHNHVHSHPHVHQANPAYWAHHLPNYVSPTPCYPLPGLRKRCRGRGRGRRGGKRVSVKKFSNKFTGTSVESNVNMINGGENNNNENFQGSVVKGKGRRGRRGGRGGKRRGRGRGRNCRRGRRARKDVSVQNYSNQFKGAAIKSNINMGNGGKNNNNSNHKESQEYHGEEEEGEDEGHHVGDSE